MPYLDSNVPFKIFNAFFFFSYQGYASIGSEILITAGINNDLMKMVTHFNLSFMQKKAQ